MYLRLMRLREPVVLELVKTSLIQSALLFLLFLDLFLLYWVIFVKLTLELVLLIDLISGWLGICSNAEPDQWGPYCLELSVKKENLSLIYVIAQFMIVPLGLFLIIIICVEIILEYQDRSSIFYNWWWHIVYKTLPLQKIEWEDSKNQLVLKLSFHNCERFLFNYFNN